MKFRIVETVFDDGERIYEPKWKKYFFWHGFFDICGRKIVEDSFERAKKHIDAIRKRGKPFYRKVTEL